MVKYSNFSRSTSNDADFSLDGTLLEKNDDMWVLYLLISRLIWLQGGKNTTYTTNYIIFLERYLIPTHVENGHANDR